MKLTFDATIIDNQIDCTIGSDTALNAPVFCFSLMAAARAVSGCTLIRGVAGYAEMQLPDIAAGQTHSFRIAHADPHYRVANRAWLPLGGYLRFKDGSTHALPLLAQGVIAAPQPSVAAFDDLRLIPQPTHWTPGKGLLQASAFFAQGEPLEQVAALSVRCNFGSFLAPDGAPLTVHHDPALADEAYILTINPRWCHLVRSRSGRAVLWRDQPAEPDRHP